MRKLYDPYPLNKVVSGTTTSSLATTISGCVLVDRGGGLPIICCYARIEIHINPKNYISRATGILLGELAGHGIKEPFNVTVQGLPFPHLLACQPTYYEPDGLSFVTETVIISPTETQKRISPAAEELAEEESPPFNPLLRKIKKGILND